MTLSRLLNFERDKYFYSSIQTQKTPNPKGVFFVLNPLNPPYQGDYIPRLP
jgi:hypothetical protein